MPFMLSFPAAKIKSKKSCGEFVVTVSEKFFKNLILSSDIRQRSGVNVLSVLTNCGDSNSLESRLIRPEAITLL